MSSKPDHNEISWTFGAETFTRKEVEALLHTQRAMVENDLKRSGGLNPAMIDILKNPRTPKF